MQKTICQFRFFETWINYITRQSTARIEGNPGALDKDYFYRFEYPDTYMSDSGMRITKFEKSTFGTPKNNFLGHLGVQPETAGQLTYTFTRAFPLSIASMPVSYDQSNLLKCTVSMSYVRYVVDGSNPPVTPGFIFGGQSDLPEQQIYLLIHGTQADANQLNLMQAL